METLVNQASAQADCCDSCRPSAIDNTALAIACTLGAGDFKARVSGIRDLARRSLQTSRREALRLHLTYGPEALEEVRDLVAKESECCAFLRFDLRHNDREVALTITAPASAAAAADELFAHFAPELAREVA
jgi:hypothetical protein